MSKILKIGSQKLDEKSCLIIAEAGVNHNGSLRMAEKLIKEAKINGANFIKFQTYKAEKLTIKKSPRFWSWSGEKKNTVSQYDSYKKLDSFNEEEYLKLKKICEKYKIEFLSTPFDLEAVDMLKRIGVKGYKIASCDITNFQLLEKVAKTRLPILLSTGASDINEIKNALNLINKYNEKVCIMHCTLNYPTQDHQANLSAIMHLKKVFKKNLIGYSDHTLGIEIAAASVAFGARIIEKHFTYNKKLKKSADHWLSITPKELKRLRNSINRIVPSIGIYKKQVLDCEMKARKFARRSLVLKENFLRGHKLSKEDITAKRPGTGISPIYYKRIIGKKLKRNMTKDTVLKFKDLI